MKKGGSLGYLTKEGFRNVWVNRLMSIASIAVLMSCLVMMGSAFMIIVNVQSIMSTVEDQNVVMIYMNDNVDEMQIQTLQSQITALDNIKSCMREDKEKSFDEMLDELGTNATYFEGVENPLPDTFRVTVSDMTKFDSTVSQLKDLENVNSIRDSREVAQTLIQLRTTITYISFGIIAVLLIISLFIIANTVRITMYSRRLEINIMKSVGATNWFIRWPFIIEGMVLGAISALVSLGVVWGVYKMIEKTVSSMFAKISSEFTIVPFTSYIVYLLAAFLIIGIISGGIGSLISIQKYLRERGGIIYEEDE